MEVPTDEQICACLAAWLMYGDTFTEEQRVLVSREYAGGFSGFSSTRIGVITLTGHHVWKVSEKGLQFLKNGGK